MSTEGTPERDDNALLNGDNRSAAELFFRAFAREIARAQREYDRLENRFMEIHAAAKYLGMTEAALRQKAGVSVPCVMLDGKLRFDRVELDRWIDRLPRKGV